LGVGRSWRCVGSGCVVRKSLNWRCSPSAIWINSTRKFFPFTQRTAAKMTSSEGIWNGRLRLNERESRGWTRKAAESCAPVRERLRSAPSAESRSDLRKAMLSSGTRGNWRASMPPRREAYCMREAKDCARGEPLFRTPDTQSQTGLSLQNRSAGRLESAAAAEIRLV